MTSASFALGLNLPDALRLPVSLILPRSSCKSTLSRSVPALIYGETTPTQTPKNPNSLKFRQFGSRRDSKKYFVTQRYHSFCEYATFNTVSASWRLLNAS